MSANGVSNGAPKQTGKANGYTSKDEVKPHSIAAQMPSTKQAGLAELIICVGGIYASLYVSSFEYSAIDHQLIHATSLTWALLQERITTTTYGPVTSPERFHFSIFLNTVQSAFAFLVGYVYLLYSSRSKPSVPNLFPTSGIIYPLLLVAITSSLAAPFGYASLKHVDYITFILAKSCKLLPVMALHVSVFRKRYPFYKYAVVALVTAGVAVFTLHHPSSSKKAKSSMTTGNATWGLLLLGINLLFDGLTNSTQDYINSAFAPYTSHDDFLCAPELGKSSGKATG